MRGVVLIAIAILISTSRPLIQLLVQKFNYNMAWSSLVYVAAAAIQGFATLYKEKSIIVWSQPMDIHFLSSWLFFYQSLVLIILSPVLYMFQGILELVTKSCDGAILLLSIDMINQ
jgi:hypothetical protein